MDYVPISLNNHANRLVFSDFLLLAVQLGSTSLKVHAGEAATMHRTRDLTHVWRGFECNIRIRNAIHERIGNDILIRIAKLREHPAIQRPHVHSGFGSNGLERFALSVAFNNVRNIGTSERFGLWSLRDARGFTSHVRVMYPICRPVKGQLSYRLSDQG